MSSVSAEQASGLNVTLLHNYRDEYHPSMRLYADRLGDALLRRGVFVRRLRPPAVVPPEWRSRSSTWANVDDWIGRFAVYPRLVHKLTCDLLHVTDVAHGCWVADQKPMRTVVTCHETVLLALAAGRIGGARLSPFVLQLFRISSELMRHAAAVVTTSAQSKRDLADFAQIDPAKITVISPGLNYQFSPDKNRGPAVRARFGLGDAHLILQVGHSFYKNVPTILRVLQRVRREGLDVRLVRVGPALVAADRADAERLGVADTIVELGMVPDGEMPGVYNAADVLLFPSLYEGWGRPTIEAMASGTPVVCSRAGALSEVVRDAALTSDAEDAEALAWHVGTVLTDRKVRDALVQRGMVNARRFDWDRAAGETAGVYRDVLGRAA